MKEKRPPRTDTMMALQRLDHTDDVQREALRGALCQWRDDCEQAKWTNATQWFENTAYLLGNHLTRFFFRPETGFGTHTFGVSDKSPYDGVVAKVADNRMIHAYESVEAMLTQGTPEPRIKPNTNHPDDEDAAAIAQLTLSLLMENPIDLPELRGEAAKIAMLCGTVAAETEYGDTDIPVPTPKYKKKREKNPLFGRIEGEPKRVDTFVEAGETVTMEQDIQARLWSPFHFGTDPRATTARDLTWIYRNSFEDIEWIREQFDRDEEGYYPEELESIDELPASRYPLFWHARIQDLIASPQYSAQGAGLSSLPSLYASGTTPGQTVLTIFDVKPSRQYPRGRTIVLAGTRLIYCGEARAWSEKYKWRWHPYRFFSWFTVPGRFLGFPLFSALVPLQKKINAIDALVQANRQYMSIGQWITAKQHRMAEGRLSGIPGEVYTYTAMPGIAPPAKAHNVPLPQELLIERQQLISSIDSIAGSGVVTGEVAASAARSGVMLDFLRKEKLRSKAPMLTRFEKFIEGIGQDVLIEIQNNMNKANPSLTERIKVAARQHSIRQIAAFTGASLRDHNAVSIDIANAALHSPEAMEAKAMEALQILGNTAQVPQLVSLLKAAGLGDYAVNPQSASVERTRRLIARIEEGEILLTGKMKPEFIIQYGIDEPNVMAPIFQEAILSDRFNDLEKDSKRTITALYDYLRMLIQMEQQAMMAAQQAAQGNGPPEEKENEAA